MRPGSNKVTISIRLQVGQSWPRIPGARDSSHLLLSQIRLHGVDKQKFTFYTWMAWVLTNKACCTTAQMVLFNPRWWTQLHWNRIFSKWFSCPFQYHSTNSPYPHFKHLSMTLYNLRNQQGHFTLQNPQSALSNL